MTKKSKRHHKKGGKVGNQDFAVVQTLPAKTQEIPTGDIIKLEAKVKFDSDLTVLWHNSKIENFTRSPGGSHDEAETETSAEYLELKNHRALADDYHRKGDEKFLENDFSGAYADCMCAMKILGEHGNISDEYGRDMKMLRNLLTKCFECYSQLIEKDPCHAFWYKRRAGLQHEEFQHYMLAYEDFTVFTALMTRNQFTLTDEEVKEITNCFNGALNIKLPLEKKKTAKNLENSWAFLQNATATFCWHELAFTDKAVIKFAFKSFWTELTLDVKKPFLTSDWINLCALCPCNDILVRDLLSVREEDRNPKKKSKLHDSAYKNVLKQMARGYHSMVVDTLLAAYVERRGKNHRCEAFLLLSLIYSQSNSSEADRYLNIFKDVWDTDQHKVPLNRRKLIFMRYVSMSRYIYILRCLTLSPFENLDLSQFSCEEQAQFYMQLALTTILNLRILYGREDERLEMNKWNLRLLGILENSCDRAFRLDRKCFYARILREYTIMEIAQIDMTGKHYIHALASFREYIEGIQHQFSPEHQSFALWCLFAAHFINRDIDASKKYGMELQKHLLYPGCVASFLIYHDLNRNISKEDVLNCIVMSEERLDNDPENFRLHLNLFAYYEYLLVFFDFCFS
uniref:Mab-21 domain-containing protein n=1 Tax=Elaeophora elaphi TaxID=1147741 RepID=A0A0R3S4Y8_9BILA